MRTKGNIVNYYLKLLFFFKMQFIPVMENLNFQQQLLQSSASHDLC